MKAIAYSRFGPPDVLELQEIEKPSPKDNEILVRVHAASINALEWRRFTLPRGFNRVMTGGILKPKDTRIGSDFAGRVEAVGATVKRFRQGDAVITNANQRDLVVLKELIEAGKVVPAIDRSYPLSEAREAIEYVLQGHPRGKVVITVRP